MPEIRVAIVGVGNCASSIVQGTTYYADPERRAIGLMHWELAGYLPSDIRFVAAFDIDERKVGLDIAEAIFAEPNCTAVFCPDVPKTGVKVQMGCVLDGVADHMESMPRNRTFVVSQAVQPDKAAVVAALKASKAEVLINFLPVGSEEATQFYMECALEAGLGVVNCMPVFIASRPEWERRFRDANLPIIGDDIKAQLGATIVHRTLANLFHDRGVKLDRTYQLNTGGNTDFMNMMDRGRLASKKVSKTEAVQSVVGERMLDENIHVGPSDYVPWLNDNKLCFLRLEGALFGNVPMNIEVRLSVEDSPNSAGVVIDAIRCVRLALDRKEGGMLVGPSSYFCKHPPIQFTDDEAHRRTEQFIAGAPGVATPKAVVIAAGQGSRLRSIAASKPLADVVGVPMIERVAETALMSGIDELVVVTGYEGEKLEGFLDSFADRRDLKLTHVRNDEWSKPNGLSVLAAEPLVGDRFVLLMCDHLFDPTILRDLLHQPMADDEVVLAVDRRLDNRLVQSDDVTRVDVSEDGHIVSIGKGLETFSAYDTGIFLASKALFAAIREEIEAGGAGSISGGMQRLADKGKARVFDIGARFWIDVDDTLAFEQAEIEQSKIAAK